MDTLILQKPFISNNIFNVNKSIILSEFAVGAATSFPFERAYFLPFPLYTQVQSIQGTNTRRRRIRVGIRGRAGRVSKSD
jgi:hypothetical protein